MINKIIVTVKVLLLFSLVFACNNFTDNDSFSITKTIEGFIQKGPFIQGTTIIIQELDNKLNPTGKNYYTTTIDDFGSFNLTSTFSARYIEVIATGYYFNEISGDLSSSSLTLRCLADLSEEKDINVNILTALENSRIRFLVNNNDMNFSEARKQTEYELLSVLKITPRIPLVFIEMDISNTNDVDGILLAVSVAFQNNNTVAELSQSIAKFASDIQYDGILDDSSLLSELKSNAETAGIEQIKLNILNKYSNVFTSIEDIPLFEKYLLLIGSEDFTPNGRINENFPTFNWPELNYPGFKYRFQLADNIDFNHLIIDISDITESEYKLDQTLEHEKKYYWCVKIIDNMNTEFDWSIIQEFIISPVLWQVSTTSDRYGYGPGMGQNGVIYNSAGDKLVSVNPDGSVNWVYSLSGISNLILTVPVIGPNGTIYFGSSNQYLYAINPDGTEKWKFLSSGIIQTNPAVGTDNVIYFTSNIFPNSRFYAVNPDGTLKWVYIADSPYNEDSSPLINSTGNIYFADESWIYAISPDGDKVWTNGRVTVSSAFAIDNEDTLYFIEGSFPEKIVAVNTAGITKWEYLFIDHGEEQMQFSPVIGPDGTIYTHLVRDGIYAINPDGTFKWHRKVWSNYVSTPVINRENSIVCAFYSTNSATIIGLDSEGQEIWSIFLNGIFINTNTVLSNNGVLYFSGSSNVLTAVETSNSGLSTSAYWPMYLGNFYHNGNANK